MSTEWAAADDAVATAWSGTVASDGAGRTGEGRAAHQGPEVDGTTTVNGLPEGIRVGDLVSAKVVGSDGVDLIAEFAALVGTPDGRPAVNLTA